MRFIGTVLLSVAITAVLISTWDLITTGTVVWTWGSTILFRWTP